MLRQAWRRKRKVLSGWLKTRRGRAHPYDSGWWDREFYASISDRATISQAMPAHWAAYHYASVELLLLRHMRPVGDVCDLGSGAGHWLKFYEQLGAQSLTGIDVSAKAVTHLRSSFPDATILHGGIAEHLSGRTFDTINAIGVMFHLVDDAQWAEAVQAIGRALRPGGQAFIGGYFGWLDRVDVQFNADGTSNKRLRSLPHWRRALHGAGIGSVRVVRNRAYLHAPCSLPESNILMGRALPVGISP